MEATVSVVERLNERIADLEAGIAGERAARLQEGRKQAKASTPMPGPDSPEMLRAIQTGIEELLRRSQAGGSVVTPHAQEEPDHYSPQQFAEKVGKSYYIVREWCRLRRIDCKKNPVSKTWEIPASELTRYLRERRLLPPKK